MWNLLAYSYAWSNKKQDAINAVNKYLTLVPAEPNPYDTKGDIHAWFMEYDSSMAFYKAAIRLRPNFTSASKLGYYEVLRQQYDNAAEHFRDYNDESPWIELHRGQIQSAIKKLNGISESSIFKVIKLRRLISYYYEMGQYSNMLLPAKKLADYSQKNPEDKIQDRDYLAWALIKNGKSADAWNVLKDVQKDAADDYLVEKIRVEYMSALLFFEDNKYDQALQTFRKIKSELPPVAEPEYFYAITLLKTGNTSDAIREFQRMSNWPNTDDNIFLGSIPGAQSDWPIPAVKSHYWLGIAYAKQGNKIKSVEEFKKFLGIWKDADFNFIEISDANLQLKKSE